MAIHTSLFGVITAQLFSKNNGYARACTLDFSPDKDCVIGVYFPQLETPVSNARNFTPSFHIRYITAIVRMIRPLVLDETRQIRCISPSRVENNYPDCEVSYFEWMWAARAGQGQLVEM